MRRLRERATDLVGLTGRRLAALPAVVAAVTAGTFALAAASPLDPLRTYMGEGLNHTSEQRRQAAAAALEMDVPWWHAWTTWAVKLLAGDAGWSHVFRQPVIDVLAERLPATALLSAAALCLALLAVWGAAVAAASRPGGVADRAMEHLAVIGAAVPSFVVATVVIGVFAVTLGWVPASGATDPGHSPSSAAVAVHLVAPAAVLAVSHVPWMVGAVRAEIRRVQVSGPVTAARMRGLSPWQVRRGHIYPWALIPLVTVTGSRLPELIAGSVVVESVFAWPGVAAAAVDAAVGTDFALLAALTTAAAVTMWAGSWLADCALLVADPRVGSDG